MHSLSGVNDLEQRSGRTSGKVCLLPGKRIFLGELFIQYAIASFGDVCWGD